MMYSVKTGGCERKCKKCADGTREIFIHGVNCFLQKNHIINALSLRCHRLYQLLVCSNYNYAFLNCKKLLVYLIILRTGYIFHSVYAGLIGFVFTMPDIMRVWIFSTRIVHVHHKSSVVHRSLNGFCASLITIMLNDYVCCASEFRYVGI